MALTGAPAVPAVPLRAGPLTACTRDAEVLDVRDPAWRTAPSQVTERWMERSGRRAEVVYRGRSVLDAIDVSWSYRVTSTDEELQISLEAVPRIPVLLNRIGLCLLHPIEE